MSRTQSWESKAWVADAPPASPRPALESRANDGGGDAAVALPDAAADDRRQEPVRRVSDIMTPDPISVSCGDSVLHAARLIKENDIGIVVVTDATGALCGVLTDRDILVRLIATGRDAHLVRVEEICSPDLTVLAPGDDAVRAERLMRTKALRRIPVVDAGRPVGIVSLGDLALENEPTSILADISAAPPNV